VACPTETLNEARVSERCDLDTGEAGDRRSDAPMDMAMELMRAVTPTATGATTVEAMERNENRKRRRKRDAPATAVAPRDFRSRMEKPMRQNVQELTQLHRTFGHLTNLFQAQAAPEYAQWFGMTTWLQETEQMWDARHEDDKLCGAGTTNISVKVMQ